MDENNNVTISDYDEEMKVEISDIDNEREENSLMCDECSLVLDSQKALDHHKKRIHIQLICDTCGQSIIDVKNIKNNKENHKKELCPNCGKQYTKKNLKIIDV